MQDHGLVECWCKFGICAVCAAVLVGVEMIADVVQAR
jgi:hypothetical protein